MNFNILANGNLEITLGRGDKNDTRELFERTPDDRLFMSELLEKTGWTPNGRLFQLKPEDVGGLTDSPIITDDRDIEDDGAVTVHGQVWWYPNYQVKHFGEELLKTGRAVFQLARTVGASTPSHSQH